MYNNDSPRWFLLELDQMCYRMQLKRTLVSSSYFPGYLEYLYEDDDVKDALMIFHEQFENSTMHDGSDEWLMNLKHVLQYSSTSEKHSQIVLWLFELTRSLKSVHDVIMTLPNIDTLFRGYFLQIDLLERFVNKK